MDPYWSSSASLSWRVKELGTLHFSNLVSGDCFFCPWETQPGTQGAGTLLDSYPV